MEDEGLKPQNCILYRILGETISSTLVQFKEQLLRMTIIWVSAPGRPHFPKPLSPLQNQCQFYTGCCWEKPQISWLTFTNGCCSEIRGRQRLVHALRLMTFLCGHGGFCCLLVLMHTEWVQNTGVYSMLLERCLRIATNVIFRTPVVLFCW